MAGPTVRVGIVGGGIGGLSLALALRERGVQADVFEQAPELTEIGAAIALSANAIREFARLGLAGELAAASTIPTELIYRHWRDGSRIAAYPVGQDDWYEKRLGAPYFGIHRADLQNILSAAFGMEHLHLGCRLVNIIEQPDSVVLEFANGRTHEADLVVGADGVRSTVRRWVTGADDVLYSGTSAFRGIVPTENLLSLPDPHAIQFWMGPDGHLLHYAIGLSRVKSRTLALSWCFRWSSGRPPVFAYQAVDDVGALDPGGHIDRLAGLMQWRSLFPRLVRPMFVVMPRILSQDLPKVLFAVDQHVVKALAA